MPATPTKPKGPSRAEVIRAFRRLGDKTAVARELGCARDTVIKYVREAQADLARLRDREQHPAPGGRWPLGPALRALIASRGISLREAARRSGVIPATVVNLCLGRPPKPATLAKILTGIGASFDDLIRAASPRTQS